MSRLGVGRRHEQMGVQNRLRPAAGGTRWGLAFALAVLMLGLWAVVAPRPVAAQITPQNPCMGTVELTSLTIPGGGQSLRGIANQPVVDRAGVRVAFWSTNDLVPGNNLDGNIEVFFRNIGSQQPEQLTDSLGTILGGFNLNPSLSADGNRVAFFSDRDLVPGRNVNGNFEIFLATRAGNGTWSIRQITDTQVGANLFPSISADGTRIAFVSDEADLHNVDNSRSNPERTFQIFLATIPANGDVTFRQITQTGIGVTNDEPVISGDGRRIAFTQSGNQGSQIYVWDAATPGATVRLTESNSNDQPAINADGSRIAYVSTTSQGRSRIVLYIAGDAQQGDRSVVIVPQSQTRQYRSPSISENGLRVAYVAETAGSTGPSVEVYLFDTTVHTQGGVPITAGGSEQPTISGDGSRVAYVRLSDAANSDSEDVGSQINITDCPLADLRLEPVNPIPTNVLAGVDLTYTFRLINGGPSPAENARVVLTDIARPNLVTLSTELSDPRCSITTGGMSCQFGDLAPGASTEFTVGWDVPTNAGLDNIQSRLVASSNAIDPNPAAADTGVLTTRVTEVANLVLTKTGSSNTIQAGASTTFFYELRLVNEGSSRARETVLIDTLPNNVQIVGSVPLSSYIVQSPNPDAFCEIATPNRVVRCELGPIPVNSTTVVRIPIVATPGAPAQLTNTAEVESETDDLTPETRRASLTTNVFRPAVMRLTKSAQPQGSVVAGTLLTYTLNVQNLGTANTVNVRVEDTLPPNVSWVDSPANSEECAPNSAGTQVICQFTPLNSGANRILTFVTRVAATAPPEPITNVAVATSGRPDPDGTQNRGTITHNVILESDLSVVKSVNTTTPDIRQAYTYTLRIRNDGPSQAYNVVVNEQLPNLILYQASTATRGSYNAGTGRWTLDAPLEVGGEATLQIRVAANQNAGGIQTTNTATISADGIDPNPANNSSSVTVTPQRANLILQMAAGPQPVVAGETLRYTLTLTNEGPSVARSARVVNTLPPGSQFVAANVAQGSGSCSHSAGVVTCQAGNINANATRVFTIDIRYLVAEPIFNTATAASNTPERTQDIANNTASITVTVVPAAPNFLTFERQPPTPTVAGVGQDPPPIVAIRDEFGNITNLGDPATLEVRLRAATGNQCQSVQSFSELQRLTGNQIAAVDGQAEFTGIIMRRAANNYRWLADVPGTEIQTACSSLFVIQPAPPARVEITTPVRNIVASDSLLSDLITVRRLDQFNNVNTAAEPTVINLSAGAPHGATGFFSNAAGSNTNSLSSVTISQGSSQISFRYRDTRAGSPTLTVSSGGLTGDSQVINIAPAATSQLVYISPPASVVAGVASNVFIVERRDPFGNVNDIEPALTVSLSTSPAHAASGSFRDVDDPLNVVLNPAQVTIPANGSRAEFRYRDIRAGQPQITAAAPGGSGIAPAQATLTVNPAAADRLVIITSPYNNVTAGTPSGIITIQRRDEFGNPNTAQPNLSVALEATAGPQGFRNQSFRRAVSPFDQVITSVTISQGNSTASFVYYDERFGTKNIQVNATNLTGDHQNITILPDVTRKIVFANAPRTLTAGEAGSEQGTTPNAGLTILRTDIYDNPNTADPSLTVSLETSGAPQGWFTTIGGQALTPANTVVIPSGESSITFRYFDTIAGVKELTASATVLDGADPFPMDDEQELTIVAAAADKLVFTPASRELVAGTVTDIFTVTRRDPFNNLADQDGEIVVNLTSNRSNGQFRDAQTQATVITNVTLGAGVAQTTFRYYGTSANLHTLTGAHTGLASATGTVNVRAAPASEIRFTANPRTTIAGVVTDLITVQRRDEFGNLANQDPALTLNLSESSGQGQFWSSAATSAPLVPANQITIPSGGTQVSFRYYNQLAVSTVSVTNFTISVTATPGISPDPMTINQNVIVNPAPAAQLVFTTDPITDTVAGQNSDVMTVQRLDAFNNPNTQNAAVTLTLSTNQPITATFYNAGGTLLSPAQINIPMGSSTASFRYRNQRVGPGTHVLTVSATLPGGGPTPVSVNQNHDIVADEPDYMQIRGPVTPLIAGTPRTLDIRAYDQFHNPALSYNGLQTLTFAGAAVSLTGNFTPTISNNTGITRTFGMTLESPLAQTVQLMFTNGVAQTDATRGLMTIYRAGQFVISAVAEANGDYNQLEAFNSRAYPVNVIPADREQFQIQTLPDEGAPFIPDQDLRSRDQLVMYVVAADAFGNGLTDAEIEVLEWRAINESPSVGGEDVVFISPISQSEVTTITGFISGTVQIQALLADSPTDTLSLPTGVIRVVPGDVDSVNVETAPDLLEAGIVPGQDVVAGTSIPVYATLRDWAGNVVSLEEDDSIVAWELVDKTLGVVDDDLEPEAGPNPRAATFTGDKVGTAVIRASIPASSTAGLTLEPSGVINVIPGDPASIELRRAGFAPDNPAASEFTVTAGSETDLVIRIFDANDNITTQISDALDMRFFGSAPSPNNTAPFVRRHADGAAVNFSNSTQLNFVNGVMTVGGNGDGRMSLFDAGDDQVITATLTVPLLGDIGLRTNPPGQITVTVVHDELARFELELTATQTNTLPFDDTNGDNIVTALDAYDNPVLDYDPASSPMQFTSPTGVVGFGSLAGSDTIDEVLGGAVVDGQVDLTAYGMTYTGTANANITFDVASTTPAASGSDVIYVDGGPAVTLSIQPPLPPSPWTAGEQQVNIQALDIEGNYSPSYAGPRTLQFGKSGFTLNDHPPYVVDVNTTPVEFGDPTDLEFGPEGEISIDMGLFAAQPNVTVTFTDTSPPPLAASPLTGSFVVDVQAAALERFNFLLSSPQLIDEPFNADNDDNRLTPEDEYGNVALVLAGVHDPITITASSGGIVTLPGAVNGDNTLVAADFNDNGTANLTDYNLTYVGTTGSITFTAVSLDPSISGISNPVLFASDRPGRLEIEGSTGLTITAGVPFTLSISAYDDVGNLANAFDGTVDMIFAGASAIGGFDPTVDGVDFGQPTPVLFTEGVAQLDTVILYRVEDVEIVATIQGPDFVGVTSHPDGNYEVEVVAAQAQNLFIAQSPMGLQDVDVALSDPPVVHLRDLYTNLAIQETGATVTATVAGPGDFTLDSTRQVTFTAGVAEFDNLVLRTAGFYTLTFNTFITDVGTLNSVNASNFNVRPGPAHTILLDGPDDVVAGETSAPFTITVVDEFDNETAVILDTQFALSGDPGATHIFTPTSPVTIPALDSSVSFDYGNTVSGLKTITAIGLAGGVPALEDEQDTHEIVVLPAAAVSIALDGPTTGTVGVPTGPYTVTTFDTFGNIAPVSELAATIDLEASPNGGDFVPDPLTIAVGDSENTFTYEDTQTGPRTLTATVTDGTAALLSAEASINLLLEPGPVADLVLVAGPQFTQTAGSILNPSIELELRDEFTNVVTTDSSSTVTVTVNGPGGLDAGDSWLPVNNGVVIFSNLIITRSGFYSLTFVTSAGPYTANTSNFTVFPAPADTIALLDGDEQNGVVTTGLDDPLRVTITDIYGNPVPDIQVIFEVTGGGGQIDGENTYTTTTDSDGIAASGVWVMGSVAGPNTAQATAAVPNGSPVLFTAEAAPGMPMLINDAGGNGQTGVVGQTLLISLAVELRDGANNVVPNSPVTFTVTAGNGSLGGQETVTVTTNAVGIAATPFTLGTVANGSNSVRAGSVANPGLTITFSAQADADGPANITRVDGNAQVAEAGETLAVPLSVLVTDQYTNPVPSVPVTFTVTLGGGDFGGNSIYITTTNGLGVATSMPWTLGDVPGPNEVEAGTTVITDTVVFTATGTVGALNALLLSDSPNVTQTAGITLTPGITVSLVDANNNVLVDQNSGTITVTVFGLPITDFTPESDTVLNIVDGQAYFDNLMLTSAGVYTLEFSTSEGSQTVSTDEFTVGPAAPDSMTEVSGNNQTGVAGSTLPLPFVVDIEDAFGNPVPGVVVTYTVQGGGGTFPGPPTEYITTTSSAGRAWSGLYTLDTVAGVNEIVAESVAGSVEFTATGTVGALNALLLSDSPNVTQTAGITLTPGITVSLVDANNNVLVDQNSGTIAVTVFDEPGLLLATGSDTVLNIVDGQAYFDNLMLTSAGVYTLEFSTSEGSQTVSTDEFTVGPAAPDSMTEVSGNNQTGVAGSTLPLPFVVDIEDAFGNPVPGVVVTYTVQGGGGTFPGPPTEIITTTSSVGRAWSEPYTLGAVAGLNSIQAESVVGTVEFTATGTVGALNALALSGSPNVSQTAGITLTPGITVSLVDANDNVLVGQNTGTITVTVFSGPSLDFTPESDTVVNIVNGEAYFDNLVLTGAGEYILEFATSEGSQTVNTTPFTVEPGPLNYYELVLASPQQNTIVFEPASTLGAFDFHGNLLDTVYENVILSTDEPGAELALANLGNSDIVPAASFVDGMVDLSGAGLGLVYTGTVGSNIAITATNAATPTLFATTGVTITAGPIVTMTIVPPNNDPVLAETSTGPFRVDFFDVSGNPAPTQNNNTITLTADPNNGNSIFQDSEDGGTIEELLIGVGQTTSPNFWYRYNADANIIITLIATGAIGEIAGLIAELVIDVLGGP